MLNMKFSNKIVSVSRHDAQYCNEKYHRDIEFIPNGINLIKSVAKKQDDYILFAAGRIYELKGLHLILESLHELNYSGKLIVIGNIDLQPEYRIKILQLAKGLNVQFIGLIVEKEILMKWVQNAKLFIFPSTSEAMSMMLLEIVSQRTPVIASDISGNTAIFDNSEIVFFKSEDSHDLSEKIRYSLDNLSNLNERALLAYKRLETNYTWSIVSSKYKDLYLSLINKHDVR